MDDDVLKMDVTRKKDGRTLIYGCADDEMGCDICGLNEFLYFLNILLTMSSLPYDASLSSFFIFLRFPYPRLFPKNFGNIKYSHNI